MNQSRHALEIVNNIGVDRHTSPAPTSLPGYEDSAQQVLCIQLLTMVCLPFTELPAMVEDRVLRGGDGPIGSLLLVDGVYRDVLRGDQVVAVANRGSHSSSRLQGSGRTYCDNNDTYSTSAITEIYI